MRNFKNGKLGIISGYFEEVPQPELMSLKSLHIVLDRETFISGQNLITHDTLQPGVQLPLITLVILRDHSRSASQNCRHYIRETG